MIHFTQPSTVPRPQVVGGQVASPQPHVHLPITLPAFNPFADPRFLKASKERYGDEIGEILAMASGHITPEGMRMFHEAVHKDPCTLYLTDDGMGVALGGRRIVDPHTGKSITLGARTIMRIYLAWAGFGREPSASEATYSRAFQGLWKASQGTMPWRDNESGRPGRRPDSLLKIDPALMKRIGAYAK